METCINLEMFLSVRVVDVGIHERKFPLVFAISYVPGMFVCAGFNYEI